MEQIEYTMLGLFGRLLEWHTSIQADHPLQQVHM